MGVDCSLFVLTDYGPYTEAAFRLCRNRNLWPQLEGKCRRLDRAFQLPHGSWCGFSDGTRPDGCEGRELGWLTKDPYGTPVQYLLGSELPELDDDSLNARVFRFVRESYPAHKVVVFFS